ncbi:MAG TPA: hypothetical protein VFJ16_05730 [Longimicrobium sp.]|nr:hypothetical protein [Longimicrobium sp.]
MKTPVLILAVSAVVAARAPLAAQGSPSERELPQLAQELFAAETVYPQERGEVQLTAFTPVGEAEHPRILGEYGITDRLQASLVTPALGSGDEGEENAWEAGVLYALLPTASPIAVSVEMEVSLADGQAPQWEPAVIAARDFGRVQLHGSVRTELSDAGDEVSGALAALVDAGRLTPTLEAVWAASGDDLLVPGLFVHPMHDVEAAIGVPVCLTCQQTRGGVRLMFTVEF